MPPTRNNVAQMFASAKQQADLYTVVQKITATSLRPNALLNTASIIFKTHLESLIKSFPPIEKSAVRDQVRNEPRCSLCLQILNGDQWTLVHLCDPRKCLVIKHEINKSYTHECDPILCSAVVCAHSSCCALCSACVDTKVETHYSQKSMFGFFWMRHRGMRKVLPRSLALRMHAWQLVLGSTYLQDFVKNGRPANRLSVFISDAIEALWCTWYPQCNCYFCSCVITSTAFKLSVQEGLLRVVCAECFENNRNRCADCRICVAEVVSYKCLSPQIYTHWPLCRACIPTTLPDTQLIPSVVTSSFSPVVHNTKLDEHQRDAVNKHIRALLNSDTERGMKRGTLTYPVVASLLDVSNGTCTLCGVRLTWGVNRLCKKQPTDFSINRIRNNLPHDSENVMICCWACNMAYRTCAFCSLSSTNRAHFVVWRSLTVCLGCIDELVEMPPAIWKNTNSPSLCSIKNGCL